MNIYQKMLAIASEAENIEKSLKVQMGAGSYKAVGETDVLSEIKPLEKKYGVFGYPLSREITESQVIESQTKDGFVKTRLFMRVKTIYRFVNVEEPTEYVDVVSFGDGLDDGDKAPGKAMTYSDKYALLKAFQCVSGDDPDQEPSEPSYRAQNGYKPTYPPISDKASTKQLETIANLLNEKKARIEDFGYSTVEHLTKQQASQVLDALFKMPKPEKKPDDGLPF